MAQPPAATPVVTPRRTRASVRAMRVTVQEPVVQSPSTLRAILNLVTLGLVPLLSPTTSEALPEKPASDAESESDAEAQQSDASEEVLSDGSEAAVLSQERATPALGASARRAIEVEGATSTTSIVEAARARHAAKEAARDKARVEVADAIEKLESLRKSAAKATKAARKARVQVDETIGSSDECLEVIVQREKKLAELTVEPAIATVSSTPLASARAGFTMGGLPAGSLQAALVATGDAALLSVAELLRSIDVTTLADFAEAGLEELVADLQRVGCTLSNSLYKRIKTVAAAARLVQIAAPPQVPSRVPMAVPPAQVASTWSS